MRDPDRIARMLALLGQYWMKYPDLRLGQIVENAKSYSDANKVPTFYVEDDSLEGGFARMIAMDEKLDEYKET